MSDSLPVKYVDVGKMAALLGDPERMDKIETHVSCGGTLIDLCRLQAETVGMPANKFYLDTLKWVRSDAARKQKYEEALAFREEYLFEKLLGIFTAINEMDLTCLLADDGSVLPAAEWPKWASICVKSFDVVETFDADGEKTGEIKRFTLWDKNKTLEAIGKHLKEFRRSDAAGESSWAKMVEDSFAAGAGEAGGV